MERDTWNPDQYERFRDERGRPFFDLLERVRPREHMRVVDLGCGTGELTRRLHEHVRAAETLGIDSSEAMLARAASLAGNGLRFERGDIATFAPGEPFDLVFSNAAIHWVPDHAALVPKLAAAVKPGGQIAVQVPANFHHPSHVSAAEVAREEPFATALAGYVRRADAVLPPEDYARLLHRSGFEEQRVSLEVYAHVFGSREDVIEWVKGTLLTDYEKRMPAELFARFLDRYREVLFTRLPDERPFFYPFPRLLFWGKRPG